MPQKFTSVWTREPPRARTAGLSREQIVRAAITLLDRDGLEALSMRKLGAELGAGATSLYWHVANKNELLELALDEFWGRVDDAGLDRATTLRNTVTTYAYSLRKALLTHRWAASLLGQIPSLGPQAFRLSDRMRVTFTEAGFRGRDVYLATGTITGFVLGQVVTVIAMEKSYGGPVKTTEVREAVDQVGTHYPAMRADYHALMPEDTQAGNAMAFDFGLLCVLDGLESRAHAQSATEAVTEESGRRRPDGASPPERHL